MYSMATIVNNMALYIWKQFFKILYIWKILKVITRKKNVTKWGDEYKWNFWWLYIFLESPLDCKEIKPVNPKGNQPWIFIGRTDAEAEAAILWPPDAKSWLIGKDPDAGKDWRQKEKRVAEDETVRLHHQLKGYESELTPGDSEGQGAWWAAVHGVEKSWTQLNGCATAKITK